MAGFLFGDDVRHVERPTMVGSGEPSLAILPGWLHALRMTATAYVYTPEGFAIAVDGRQTWVHSLPRGSRVLQLQSDRVQKLFEITGKYMVLAYSIKGHGAILDKSFDMISEMNGLGAELRHTLFLTLHVFLKTIAFRLQGAIADALQREAIDIPPATEICFVGYFRGKPRWVDLVFRPCPDQHGNLFEIIEHRLEPGYCVVSGSLAMQSLFYDEDERVVEFITPLNDTTSLPDAIKLVNGYVKACCSDWAHELDSNLRHTGGHVYAAIVTSPETLKTKIIRRLRGGSEPTTGFQWVIPPWARE